MTQNLIVAAPIDCIDSHGSRRTVVVEIGTPYPRQVSEEWWACPVKIRGLYDHLADIRGVDSLQALCGALSLVRSLLTTFVENGGRVMHPNTESDYDLKVSFGWVADGSDHWT